MNVNMIIQYLLVVLLIAGALTWIALRMMRKSNRTGCGDCSLSQICRDNDKKEKLSSKHAEKKTCYVEHSDRTKRS